MCGITNTFSTLSGIVAPYVVVALTPNVSIGIINRFIDKAWPSKGSLIHRLYDTGRSGALGSSLEFLDIDYINIPVQHMQAI